MSFAVTRALSAVVLLVLGFALQALGRTPPVDLGPIVALQLNKDGTIDADFVKKQIAFATRKIAYSQSVEAPYSKYPGAFFLARSEADFPKIKAAIDREIRANDAIEADGMAAVPGLTGDRLASPSLWLVALAAALAFQSFAFVMGGAFLAGLFHAVAAEMSTLTGLTSEHYLAAILAALIVAAAGWLALRRLWPAPA